MPIGMWRPWSSNTALAKFSNGITKVKNQNAAFLICYEALLVWPVLQSMINKPDLLVSIGSTWWAPKSIHISQKNSMHAWARLFNKNLIEAYNL